MNCRVYTVLRTIYSVQCTLYNVHCTMYTVQCTLYNVHCTMYTVQCTLYYVHCTTYNVHCTVYNVQCSIYWRPLRIRGLIRGLIGWEIIKHICKIYLAFSRISSRVLVCSRVLVTMGLMELGLLGVKYVITIINELAYMGVSSSITFSTSYCF